MYRIKTIYSAWLFPEIYFSFLFLPCIHKIIKLFAVAALYNLFHM